MREFVESLRRLYKFLGLVPLDKIERYLTIKLITQEEYDYIVAE